MPLTSAVNACRDLSSYSEVCDAWNGDHDFRWIAERFLDAFEAAGERMPRVKRVQPIHVPGLLTANRQLRESWGGCRCCCVTHLILMQNLILVLEIEMHLAVTTCRQYRRK